MIPRFSTRVLSLTVMGAVLAIASMGIGAATLGGGSTANAQIDGNCVEYFLCVTKVAPGGGNTNFPFVIELDEGSVSTAEEVSFVLQDGDSAGFYFERTAVIKEIPISGWRLVGVKCEGNLDIRYIPGGVALSIPGDIQLRTVECVFRNEPVQPQLNLGGLFAGQPTPLPTAPPPPAAVAPATSQGISPPRTGDGGLK